MAPFASEKQRRFMFARHPEIAERWVEEAKESGRPIVEKAAEHAKKVGKHLAKKKKL